MSQEPTGTPARPAPAKVAGSPAGSAAGGGQVQGFSPLPTGYRIGELTVQSVLGAGEFGITYSAEHEKPPSATP